MKGDFTIRYVMVQGEEKWDICRNKYEHNDELFDNTLKIPFKLNKLLNKCTSKRIDIMI